MKRPARLTWLKGGEPAHGKPVNGLFAYSPFTARYPRARYALSELGPVASSGPSNMIQPVLTSGLCVAHDFFRPI